MRCCVASCSATLEETHRRSRCCAPLTTGVESCESTTIVGVAWQFHYTVCDRLHILRTRENSSRATGRFCSTLFHQTQPVLCRSLCRDLLVQVRQMWWRASLLHHGPGIDQNGWEPRTHFPRQIGLDLIEETGYRGLVQLGSALHRRSILDVGVLECQIASCRDLKAPASCRPRLAGLRLKEIGKAGQPWICVCSCCYGWNMNAGKRRNTDSARDTALEAVSSAVGAVSARLQRVWVHVYS